MKNEVTISKEFEFAMAHRLRGHAGLCKNLHGHNYKMIVGVTGTPQTKSKTARGMIVDFKDLKDTVNDVVIDLLDHATLVEDKDKSLKVFLEKQKSKHVVVPFRTTTENLAKYIFKLLQHRFGESTKDIFSGATIPRHNGKLAFIELHESGSSVVRYSK